MMKNEYKALYKARKYNDGKEIVGFPIETPPFAWIIPKEYADNHLCLAARADDPEVNVRLVRVIGASLEKVPADTE